ncbi:MAG: cobalamin biosynthesis protein, partial [Haloarculaceae archaeon]
MLGAAAVALAALLDWLAGELPRRLHPVAWFGRLVAPLDRVWRHPRVVGALGALALPLAAAAVVGGAVWLASVRSPPVGAALAGLALFTTTSLRMLLDAAGSVVAASESDPAAARADLPALAGRDPSGLSAGELRSAAVESAAENLADGLVA